jgi:hypothetical protein
MLAWRHVAIAPNRTIYREGCKGYINYGRGCRRFPNGQPWGPTPASDSEARTVTLPGVLAPPGSVACGGGVGIKEAISFCDACARVPEVLAALGLRTTQE